MRATSRRISSPSELMSDPPSSLRGTSASEASCSRSSRGVSRSPALSHSSAVASGDELPAPVPAKNEVKAEGTSDEDCKQRDMTVVDAKPEHLVCLSFL